MNSLEVVEIKIPKFITSEELQHWWQEIPNSLAGQEILIVSSQDSLLDGLTIQNLLSSQNHEATSVMVTTPEFDRPIRIFYNDNDPNIYANPTIAYDLTIVSPVNIIVPAKPNQNTSIYLDKFPEAIKPEKILEISHHFVNNLSKRNPKNITISGYRHNYLELIVVMAGVINSKLSFILDIK